MFGAKFLPTSDENDGSGQKVERVNLFQWLGLRPGPEIFDGHRVAIECGVRKFSDEIADYQHLAAIFQHQVEYDVAVSENVKIDVGVLHGMLLSEQYERFGVFAQESDVLAFVSAAVAFAPALPEFDADGGRQ